MQPLSASQLESLEEATATYQAGITPAVAGLLKARGIDKATALTFRLGVVANPVPGHSRYVGKLAIPYLDKDGVPLSMRFRCAESHNCRDYGHGKYLGLPDEPTRMFNIGAIHRASDQIHVTEGEFDAMILTRIGLHAVAIPGVQNWKPHHRRMLAGFDRIWVWADPDDAGADLARRITQASTKARAVRLREDDVTDTYIKHGADALLTLIGDPSQ